MLSKHVITVNGVYLSSPATEFLVKSYSYRPKYLSRSASTSGSAR